MDPKEIVNVLIGSRDNNSKESSILDDIEEVLLYYVYEEEVFIIKEFMIEMKEYNSPKEMLFLFRLCCLLISHLVLSNEIKKKYTFTVFSDIIYFYAFTHTYFTNHDYDVTSSE